MKRIASLFLSVLMLCPVCHASVPKLSAGSAILMDAGSGRILYALGIHERRPVASITKLMTALVAVESHADITDSVSVPEDWTGVEGSSMYLKAGEMLTLHDLLCGLLLVSGNDSAALIADFCAGDESRFVQRMNEKAGQLGMRDSHFANPSGLPQEDHYSTAYDMALLAVAVLGNEVLAPIVRTRTITIGDRHLKNHNKLLWQYPGCIGLKTGFTRQSGRTLVSCAERDGLRLVAVTLNAPDDWNDHRHLYDYGFSTFARTELIRKDECLGYVPAAGNIMPAVPVCAESSFILPLSSSEHAEQTVQLFHPVSAPLEAGTPVGQIIFSVNGIPAGRTRLVLKYPLADHRRPSRKPVRRFSL